MPEKPFPGNVRGLVICNDYDEGLRGPEVDKCTISDCLQSLATEAGYTRFACQTKANLTAADMKDAITEFGIAVSQLEAPLVRPAAMRARITWPKLPVACTTCAGSLHARVRSTDCHSQSVIVICRYCSIFLGMAAAARTAVSPMVCLSPMESPGEGASSISFW